VKLYCFSSKLGVGCYYKTDNDNMVGCCAVLFFEGLRKI
jgi:hypothetical protein